MDFPIPLYSHGNPIAYDRVDDYNVEEKTAMQVILENFDELGPDNMPLLTACLQRIAMHQNVTQATVIISARQTEKHSYPGWLEFLLRVEYEHGGKLTIGALQRKPGEPFEFHS